ncbi:MAG: hypothetical protein CFE21_04790 [Bacteroidetes bacterium B1(2017)]|nr:MAG: hypothetical protein CFE21_04790 [Bacteroidetes bacterium B1(2017)]
MKIKLLHKFLKGVFLFVTFFYNTPTYAWIFQIPTIIGSEVSYTPSGTPYVYNIQVKVYRDCAGAEICANCPTSLSPSCGLSIAIIGNSPGFVGVAFGTANLTVVNSISGFDAVQLCATNRSICSNCGSRTPGTFTPGVEVYVFTGQINLSALPSGCCEVRIGAGVGKRNSASTSIINPTGSVQYNEAIINRCITPNNAPVFTNDPVILVPANQDAVINLGAIDPDGDSLSYAIAPSLDTTNYLSGTPASVVYSPGFSAQSPFPYLGIAQGPNAPYPAGIHINQLTGDILFRPIGTFTEYIKVEVIQWRKINGVATRVGVTYRETSIASRTSTSYVPQFFRADTLEQNKIPLANPFGDTISLCHGQTWCTNIVARSSSLAPDTTNITLVQTAIPNYATLTKLYNNATRSINGPREDSVRICFTMPIDTNLYNPYVVSVAAKGKNCTLTGPASKSFLIYPSKQNVFALSTKNLLTSTTCTFGYMRVMGAYPEPVFTRINIENAPSSNVYTTFKAEQITHTLTGPEGWYKFIIQLSGACSNQTIYDSVYIARVKIKFVKSQEESCYKAHNAKLIVADTIAVGPVQYAIDTFAYQSSAVFDSLAPGNHWVYVKDSMQFKDSILVNIPATPALAKSIQTTNASCLTASNGSAHMTLSGGTEPYLVMWSSAPVQTGLTATNLSPRKYSYEVLDSSGCTLSGDVTIGYKPVYALSEICAISIDTPSFHPNIVWQKTPNQGIKAYQIWSSLNGSTYSLEASIPFASTPSYTDSTSIALGSIKSFIIKAEDSCSVVSAGSAFHKPMFLASSKLGSFVRLNWSPYYGQNGSTFSVWRKVNSGAFTLLTTLPNYQLNFTDSTPPSGLNTITYLIGLNGVSCSSKPILSNTSTHYTTGIHEHNPALQNIEFYPNPSSGKIKLNQKSNPIEINEIVLINIDGKELQRFVLNDKSKQIELDLSAYSDGVYQLLVQTKAGNYSQKIVLQH